jgi:hypothetical protein
MTREEALAVIKLLSGLESWSFSLKERTPDYLHDDLHKSMAVLERIVLEQSQEKYIYGTPLMDAMKGMNP